MTQKNSKSLEKALIIFVFGLMIFTPLITSVFLEDKLFSGIEKRSLAKAPSLPSDIKQLNEFPRMFEQYYADHFGYREEFTKQYFKLMKRLGGSSSLDDVTLGQDGWFFLGSVKPGYTGYGDPIGDSMNVNLFNEAELALFAEALISKQLWLSKKGIKYIYMIAPNKHTIYFEKLPEYIKKQSAYSATDQLVDYIKKNTDVSVLDLRAELVSNKKRHRLYYKADSHWNHYGANVAQYELGKLIHTVLPEINPILLSDTSFSISNWHDGDLPRLLGIDSEDEKVPSPVFENQCEPVWQPVADVDVFSSVCSEQSKTALIFGDSFFRSLRPYIARYFEQATFVYLDRMSRVQLEKYVESVKPSVVVEEIVERKLPYVPSGFTGLQ